MKMQMFTRRLLLVATLVCGQSCKGKPHELADSTVTSESCDPASFNARTEWYFQSNDTILYFNAAGGEWNGWELVGDNKTVFNGKLEDSVTLIAKSKTFERIKLVRSDSLLFATLEGRRRPQRLLYNPVALENATLLSFSRHQRKANVDAHFLLLADSRVPALEQGIRKALDSLWHNFVAGADLGSGRLIETEVAYADSRYIALNVLAEEPLDFQLTMVNPHRLVFDRQGNRVYWNQLIPKGGDIVGALKKVIGDSELVANWKDWGIEGLIGNCSPSCAGLVVTIPAGQLNRYPEDIMVPWTYLGRE